MSRNRRFFRLALLAALLCGAIAGAAAPEAQAADHTYFVDSAKDTAGSDPLLLCTDSNPNNKNCTLRQALTLAESDTGTSEIRFVIPANAADPDFGYDATSQTWTIKPASALPTLAAGGTTITGRLSFGGAPRIVVDGTSVPGASAVGFKITSSNNVLQRVAVVNFRDTAGANGIGVLISGAGATGNNILSSFIGVGPSGNSAQPNSGAGVRIDSSAANNTIGGADFSDRNLISGNGTGVLSGTGILLVNTSRNTIQGNYIGVGIGASGTLPLPNTGVGIQVSDSISNTIGGEFDERNVISANGLSGVLLTGSGTANNTLAGNLIGTDETGLVDFGNGGAGVQIVNRAANNTISGNDSTHSVISGNGGDGVLISDNGTLGNKILGSYIGVADDGTTALPNARDGVRIQNDAASTAIGAAGQGNVIGGNGGVGVFMGATSASFTAISANKVISNSIGLNFDATTATPNGAGGVLLGAGANANEIGGSSPGEQNLIGGNGGPGVVVSGTAVLNNVIAGNVIGLKRAGSGKLTSAAPNAGDGLVIGGGARGTRAEANVIAANAGNGVHISGTGTTTTTLQSNLIGATRDGATLLGFGNTQNGVLVESAARTVVITGSTIFSNTLNGVLATSGAQQVKITDNRISRNGAKGIELDPETSGAPGVATNPNHDIDPPFNLSLNQAGLLTGRVLVDGSNAACSSCLIQIFTPDPLLLDGQGRDKVNVPITLAGSGIFTATLPTVPAQVLVTATDGAGNTSEFARFERIFRVAIGPARPQQQAVPGQTVTFTHFVSNTGTIGLLDLQITATSQLKWPLTLTPSPATTFALPANSARPITLTLTLPTGSDPRVFAGLIEQTRITVRSTGLPTVTASLTDSTLVSPQFLLSVNPLTRSGIAKRGDTVPYVHTLTNNGNISTTVTLSANTDLTWATAITPTSHLLRPGETITATARVTVPPTVVANTVAKTTIRVTSPDATQNKTLTDTTTITSTVLAQLTPNYDNAASVGAGNTISFLHRVDNLSNGPATFKLFASSSLGSRISFRSATAGITLGPGNSFTLGEPGKPNSFNFFIDVTISLDALPGAIDQITIGLTDANGVVIGSASAQDTIPVAQGGLRPRVNLPIIMR